MMLRSKAAFHGFWRCNHHNTEQKGCVNKMENTISTEGVKPFTEMTSRELFVILTGGQGVMQQMYLQNILKEYLNRHGDTTDLVTMVRSVAEEHGS